MKLSLLLCILKSFLSLVSLLINNNNMIKSLHNSTLYLQVPSNVRIARPRFIMLNSSSNIHSQLSAGKYLFSGLNEIYKCFKNL